jgi:nitronate monooxygenase
VYHEALKNATDNQTTLTNILTGRPARGIVNRAIRELGPMSDSVPDFPLAAAALGPLRSKAEAAGSSDFTPLWSGQAARLARELPAAELTKRLAAEALEILRTL